MSRIPCNNYETVNQRGRCDLLIERVFRIGHSKATPNLSTLVVESENCLLIRTGDLAKPAPGVKLSVVSSFPSWMMETEDNVSHEETTAYERV